MSERANGERMTQYSTRRFHSHPTQRAEEEEEEEEEAEEEDVEEKKSYDTEKGGSFTTLRNLVFEEIVSEGSLKLLSMGLRAKA